LVKDKEVLQRIEDIEQLDEETRSKLFFLIDNVIQNFKAKKSVLLSKKIPLLPRNGILLLYYSRITNPS
jgi:hypothetical protein